MINFNDTILKISESVATLTAHMTILTSKMEDIETVFRDRASQDYVDELNRRLKILEDIHLKREAVLQSKTSLIEFLRKYWVIIITIIGFVASAGYTIEIAKQSPSQNQQIKIDKLENLLNKINKGNSY